MRIDIRDSKYSIIYNEKTGTVEDVLWCNESAEDLKNLNIVADMARELAVYRQAGRHGHDCRGAAPRIQPWPGEILFFCTE